MSDLKLGNKTGNIFAEHGKVNCRYSAVAIQVGCGFNHINLISRNILAHESQVDSRYLAVAVQVAEHYSAESAFRALAFLIKRVFGFVFCKAAGTLIPVMGLVKSLSECVRRLVLFLMANTAFKPMICFIVLLLVTVGYRSCIAANITSCVACVIEDVCSYVFLAMANRAFIPVTVLIMLLLVVVGYRSCIAASITGRVASIVKDVRSDILPITADCALIPVLCIVVLLLVVVGYASHIAAGVTGCIAGVVEDVSCNVFLFAA